MIEINTKRATDRIKKEFDSLTGDELNKGVGRAINHTIRKARTQSSRAIRQVYAVKHKYIKKALSIRKASRFKQTGKLIASGQPIPLIAFSARQTQKGVSVAIKKGQRKTIRSSFKATMPSGHTGVFARGKYRGGEFQFRKKRIVKTGPDLPITELKTLSIPKQFQQKRVAISVRDKVNEDYPDRLIHELRYLAGKV